MAVYALLIYVFLYAPIALIVFFSFNAGRYAMDWQGFSIQWYGRAFTNPLIVEALFTSLTIAGSTAVLSVIFGTLAALGLERTRGILKHAFDGLIYIAIMVPGIVIGISTLIAFVTLFDAVNPTVERLLSWKFQMGIWTVIAAHVLFNIAVVCLLVRARLTGMDRGLVDDPDRPAIGIDPDGAIGFAVNFHGGLQYSSFAAASICGRPTAVLPAQQELREDKERKGRQEDDGADRIDFGSHATADRGEHIDRQCDVGSRHEESNDEILEGKRECKKQPRKDRRHQKRQHDLPECAERGRV